MNLQLQDRIAIVAGSSRGIGKAIASALLREGCRVCITGRDQTSLQQSAEGLRAEFGDRVLNIAGDFSDSSVIESALSEVEGHWGRVEILVANLGTGSGKPGWQQDEGEWQRLFNLNFFGSVRLAQATIPHLQKGGGSILL